MINDIYWLWLQKALGTSKNIRELLEYYTDAKSVYEDDVFGWGASGLLTPKMIERLSSISLDECVPIIEECKRRKWDIITYEDENYPFPFKKLPNPPCALFLNGKLPDLNNRLTVAVVGSRTASEYAMNAASYISSSVAACGAVIVSGGAPGVDRCSHEAAMNNGAFTVCVLGTGLDSSYPAECSDLRRRISYSGCLITEYPPFSPPIASFFSARNRLISALSDAVVVVEAKPKSGSLVTAKYAKEQGKELFALPGSIVSPYNAGTNEWLSSGKAKPVFTPKDILTPFIGKYESIDMSRIISLDKWLDTHISMRLASDYRREAQPRRSYQGTQSPYAMRQQPQEEERQPSAKTPTQKKEIPNLSPELRTIYNSLTEDYQHIDIIIHKTSISGPQVLSALTQLELMGLAGSAAGRRYRKE